MHLQCAVLQAKVLNLYYHIGAFGEEYFTSCLHFYRVTLKPRLKIHNFVGFICAP